MIKEEFKKPIEYIVENKNGVHEYLGSFVIDDTIRIIRIIILHPVGGRNPIMDIVKKISNKDKNIPFNNSGTDYCGWCSTVNDLYVNEFLNSTNDLKFELIENSKIRVILIYKRKGYERMNLPQGI